MLSITGGIVLPDFGDVKIPSHFSLEDTRLVPKKHIAPLIKPSYNNKTLDAMNRRLEPYRYIVIFKDHVYNKQITTHVEELNQFQVHDLSNLHLKHPFFTYKDAMYGGIISKFDLGTGFKGYYGYFTDNTINFIREQKIVEYVEMDSEVHTDDKVVQGASPWQLARTSHRKRLTLNTYREYKWDNAGTGEGVDVYLLDTGVYKKNPMLVDKVNEGINTVHGEPYDDLNGHGTQMAGLIVTKFGVSEAASLWDIKVLDWQGRGLVSDIIKGMDWARSNHNNQLDNKFSKASILLFTISGPRSVTFDKAVDKMVSNGLHVVVGAGTRGIDACNTSPAAAKKPIKVAGLTITDEPIDNANWGHCVDFYAPGENLLTTWPKRKYTSMQETRYITGSSAAAAHAASVVAYYLSMAPLEDDYPVITPAELKLSIKNIATPNKIRNIPLRTRNLILYNGAGMSLGDFFGQHRNPSKTTTTTTTTEITTSSGPTPGPTSTSSNISIAYFTLRTRSIST